MSPPPLRPMDTDQAAGGQTRPALPASSTGFWALWLDVQTTAAEGVSLTRPRGQLSVFPTGVSETVVLMKKMSWTPPSPPSSGPDGCLFGSRMAPTWVQGESRRAETTASALGDSPEVSWFLTHLQRKRRKRGKSGAGDETSGRS